MLGQRRRRYPSREAFVASLTNEGEMIDTVALCPIHCKTKARLR
jgi:hypothetical protein